MAVSLHWSVVNNPILALSKIVDTFFFANLKNYYLQEVTGHKDRNVGEKIFKSLERANGEQCCLVSFWVVVISAKKNSGQCTMDSKKLFFEQNVISRKYVLGRI